MNTAELYIKERNFNGKSTEELWIAIRKIDGVVLKRLRYLDLNKLKNTYPIRNSILLKYLNLRKGITNTGASSESNPDMCQENQRISVQIHRKPKTIWVTGKVRKKSFIPDPSSEYVHFYFQLTGNVIEKWKEIFLAGVERKIIENQSRFNYIWIEDDYLIARCKQIDLKRTYIEDIKPSVKLTNQIFVSLQDKLILLHPMAKSMERRLPTHT
ncbi:MAG: hypothetical protein KKH41_00555 [Candidatus Thermoplasmatota archaeon]|nr:hypothetical protein [Euryarchaeota archaeon]MBU4031581.1 hypothetical protein [Candidatus Thermoplasmatota archaeon]MBU4071164.1 hypothetical protein [Candidatus Thermoplasmatota archaeon]MBU4145078.1 hypothetical protein [Candidatus Thermoplasmatota archaeon]MBU4591053.1 hypothetical protein [Candidatus Thermoplasmatota archaeon]